jgi:hypothetical protein
MPEITDEELAQLRQQETDAGVARAAALAADERAAAATTALATTLRAANPSIPADAIAGNTPEELTASVERARAIATHAVEAHTAANPAPATPTAPAGATTAGAPARTTAPNGLHARALTEWAVKERNARQ